MRRPRSTAETIRQPVPSYEWLEAERERQRRDEYLLSVLSGAIQSFEMQWEGRQKDYAKWRFSEFMRLLEHATDRSPQLFMEVLRLAVTDSVLTGRGETCVVCHHGFRGSRYEWPYSVLKHCYTQRHVANLVQIIAEGRIGQLFVHTPDTRDYILNSLSPKHHRSNLTELRLARSYC